ncbi:hypothetical protein METP3_00567 [Methanosarcinales archaeon]|nr:hypothetical protein METP3_00567 [Methanosarcinales archaeon]
MKRLLVEFSKRMYMKTKFKMLCVFMFGILALSLPASANTLYVDDDTEDSYSCEGMFMPVYPCSNAVDESWDGWPWYAEAYSGWTSYVYEEYIIPSGISGADWTFKVQIAPNPSKVEVWYWDYSSNSWDILYSNLHSFGIYTFTVNIPSDGLTTSPLKIKTKTQNYIEVVDYFEGKVTWIYTIPAITATIDIDPNTLNLGSNGEWITAYIEFPEGYDVNNINVSKVNITTPSGNSLLVDISAPATVGDYNSNGIPDMMVKFNRATLAGYLSGTGTDSEVALKVTGELLDGTQFEGTDTVRVIKKGRNKI